MNGPDDEAGDTGLDLDTGTDADAGTGDGSELGFDLGASVDAAAKGMKLGGEREQQAAAPGAQVDPEPLAPPKSWAADKHELWKTLPRNAQEYYNTREQQFLTGIEQYKGDAGFAKQLREIINPYLPMLRAQGVSETDATKYLFNAHYRLTNGTPEERRAAYEAIGKDLGFSPGGNVAPAGEGQQTDPLLKQLQTELGQIKSTLSDEQRARHEQVRQKSDAEVQAFAADKTNLYFGEVAKDMVGFINQGMDLKVAYEKAVWANPVTRAKEIARLQTEDAAKNKGSPQAAEAARRAASVNARGTETARAPTEQKGKFLSDASLKEDLRAIRARH